MSVFDNVGGKGKKALFKLKAIQEEVDSIEKKLEDASTILQNAIEFLGTYLSPKQDKRGDKGDSQTTKVPKRVQFECNDLKFYIDFAIAPSESSDPTNIQGIIIYGVRRTLCLADRIMKGEELETKPLIQFSVNRHGIIKSNGTLEGAWSLQDENQDLLDMHCRALDSIWGQALGWRNENILP